MYIVHCCCTFLNAKKTRPLTHPNPNLEKDENCYFMQLFFYKQKSSKKNSYHF